MDSIYGRERLVYADLERLTKFFRQTINSHFEDDVLSYANGVRKCFTCGWSLESHRDKKYCNAKKAAAVDAIVVPGPTAGTPVADASVDAIAIPKKKKSGTCSQFKRGVCTKGDACSYKHIAGASTGKQGEGKGNDGGGKGKGDTKGKGAGSAKKGKGDSKGKGKGKGVDAIEVPPAAKLTPAQQIQQQKDLCKDRVCPYKAQFGACWEEKECWFNHDTARCKAARDTVCANETKYGNCKKSKAMFVEKTKSGKLVSKCPFKHSVVVDLVDVSSAAPKT
jgi:hypothetical protein